MNNNTKAVTEVAEDRIYRSYDLTIFKKSVGNRNIDPRNLAIIKRSIKKYGPLNIPIRVNEKMEVIDGQHRLQAFKELGIPSITYIICPGEDSENAVIMNNNGRTVWKTMDYIDHHANRGNQDYKFMRMLCDKYKEVISPTIVLELGVKVPRQTDVSFRAGKFTIEPVERVAMWNRTDWLAKMAPYLPSVGIKNYWLRALAFCYDNKKIDTEQLESKIITFSWKLKPSPDKLGALEQIEKIYNYHSHTEKVYVMQLYKEWEDAKKRNA